jgi:hypothetical protein
MRTPLAARGLIVLLALSLLLGGCGGSGATAPTEPEAAGRQPHGDPGGGSRQFLLEGGDNSIQRFGQEAATAEREAAAAALHAFLDARAEADWATACRYAGADLLRSLRQAVTSSGSQVRASCAVILRGLAAGVPPRSLREAAAADVGSLRVEGARGYLLYRGLPPETVYAFPMLREGDAWKVEALAGAPLN